MFTVIHWVTSSVPFSVCMCLPSCSILQRNSSSSSSLSFTRGPVSVSIFVQFFLQLLYILCHYQSIPSPYASLGKVVLFCVQANSYAFFLVSPQISSLFFPFHYYIFYLFLPSCSSIYILKLNLSLSISVVSCISFSLYVYVRSSKSGTILIALYNFNTFVFLLGDYYFCIFQFWSNHCSYNFSDHIFIYEVKNHPNIS